MLWELYAHVQGGGAAHYSIHLYKGVCLHIAVHMYKGVGLHIAVHMYKGVCLYIAYTHVQGGGAAHCCTHVQGGVSVHCLYTCTRGWGSIVYVCTSASLRSEVVEEGAEVALSPGDVDKGISSCHAGTLPAITFTHRAIGAVTG